MTDTPTAESDGDAQHPTDGPTLRATPGTGLVDEPLTVELTGLEPGRRVTLAAAFADLDERWAGEATFEADADGVVDPAERAPVAGDYDGARPMGLVQAARRRGDGERTAAYDLQLSARADGATLAEATVTRRTRAPGVEQVTLDPAETGLAGELYLPPDGDRSRGPEPGVLLLHGSGGTLPRRKAAMLASRGVAALALQYVGEPEPVPDVLREVPASYFGRAVDWLRGREAVAGGGVGVLGVSRGTEAAVLTAAHCGGVDAVVAYAPSAYCWPGRGEDPAGTPAAWSVDGEPVPTVPHPDGEPPTEETDRGVRPRAVFEECLEYADGAALDAARLPVEGVEADVLLVSGRDDGVWPATEMGEELAARLREADAASVTHLAADDAGHSILLPYHPTTERVADSREGAPDVDLGGTPAGIAAADVESWPAVLDVLGGDRPPGRTTGDRQ